MPFGLGHWWIALQALVVYAAIIVVVVLVARSVVQALRRLAASAAALEGIQRTLTELKASVDAIERRLDKD